MFRFNNKNIRTTTFFTASVVDFEKVNFNFVMRSFVKN